MRATRAQASVAALLLALGLAGCASSPSPTSSPTSSPTLSRPGIARTSPTASPSLTPSVPAELTAFFTAAELQDGQLRAAAALINAGVGSSTITLTSQAKAAVLAIDPRAVARTIPAGLPPTLQLAVLVVYSDLDSRREAMRRIDPWASHPGTSVLTKTATVAGEGGDLLRCLANGGPAAARFPLDLAEARALAQRTPALTPASPQSRAATELAVRIALVDGQNGGCESCGGFTVARLAVVSWHPTTFSGTHWDGTVGGSTAQPGSDIAFQATYLPGSGWQVRLNAC